MDHQPSVYDIFTKDFLFDLVSYLGFRDIISLLAVDVKIYFRVEELSTAISDGAGGVLFLLGTNSTEYRERDYTRSYKELRFADRSIVYTCGNNPDDWRCEAIYRCGFSIRASIKWNDVFIYYYPEHDGAKWILLDRIESLDEAWEISPGDSDSRQKRSLILSCRPRVNEMRDWVLFCRKNILS